MFECPDFRKNAFESITDAMHKFVKVESLQDEAVIVGLVEDLEGCEGAENVLYDCQHFTSLRS